MIMWYKQKIVNMLKTHEQKCMTMQTGANGLRTLYYLNDAYFSLPHSYLVHFL